MNHPKKRSQGNGTHWPRDLVMVSLCVIVGVFPFAPLLATDGAPQQPPSSMGDDPSPIQKLRDEIQALEVQQIAYRGRVELLRQILANESQEFHYFEDPAIAEVRQELQLLDRQLDQARITYVDGHTAITVLEQQRQAILDRLRQRLHYLLRETENRSEMNVQLLAVREHQLLALTAPKSSSPPAIANQGSPSQPEAPKPATPVLPITAKTPPVAPVFARSEPSRRPPPASPSATTKPAVTVKPAAPPEPTTIAPSAAPPEPIMLVETVSPSQDAKEGATPQSPVGPQPMMAPVAPTTSALSEPVGAQDFLPLQPHDENDIKSIHQQMWLDLMAGFALGCALWALRRITRNTHIYPAKTKIAPQWIPLPMADFDFELEPLVTRLPPLPQSKSPSLPAPYPIPMGLELARPNGRMMDGDSWLAVIKEKVGNAYTVHVHPTVYITQSSSARPWPLSASLAIAFGSFALGLILAIPILGMAKKMLWSQRGNASPVVVSSPPSLPHKQAAVQHPDLPQPHVVVESHLEMNGVSVEAWRQQVNKLLGSDGKIPAIPPVSAFPIERGITTQNTENT